MTSYDTTLVSERDDSKMADSNVLAAFGSFLGQYFLNQPFKLNEEPEDLLLSQIIIGYAHDGQDERHFKEKRGKTEAKINPCCQLVGAEFQDFFRVSLPSFEKILLKLSPILSRRGPTGRTPIKPQTQLSAVIWLLSNQEPFRCVGDRFGMSKSSLEVCFQRVIKALEDIHPTVVQWPTSVRMNLVQKEFQERFGIGGVVGAIRFIHIPVKVRKDDSAVGYPNRKDPTSVMLQATCDHSMTFTKCHVSVPMSVDDPEVPWITPFFEDLEQKSLSFPNNGHLVSDCSYPIKSWLLAPYKDELLTTNQSTYNDKLAQAHSTITRAFRLLKGRFRRLAFLQMQRTDLIPRCITACCVLHNMCLEEDLTMYDNDVSEIKPESVVVPSQDDLAGCVKRDRISALFLSS